jgi:soluble lytic murein transglycosylase-like protein
MAYNAGPTRVRRWIRRGGAMPDVMMVERFPFAETRHYVRKIMVTTILYSILYTEDIGVSEAVALFFPSLPSSAAPIP